MRAIVNLVKRINTQSIDNYMIYAIVATIPLTVSLGNIAIIIAFIYAILTSKNRFLNQSKKYHLVLILPFVYYFIILLSAAHSNNIIIGLKLVDKSLFFLLIPIILVCLSENINFKKLLLIFAKSTFGATGILVLYSVFMYLTTLNSDNLFFHNFTRLFDLHPVYFSINLALSVFILTKHNRTGKDKSSLNIVMIIVLIIGIILSASKIVILLFSIIYFIQLNKIFNQRHKKYTFIPLFIIVIIVLFTLPKLKNRFIEGFEFNLSFAPTTDVASSKVFNYEDKHLISDLEIRYIFGSIGVFHSIKDNKILFGYGVGDTQDYLDLYYMQYGLAPNWYEGYNVHNQYVQILISTGIFSLLFFLYYILLNLKMSFKYMNSLGIVFLTLILCVFFVESMLMRNKGIVLFVFFTSLFLIQNLKYENSNIRNKGDSKQSWWF